MFPKIQLRRRKEKDAPPPPADALTVAPAGKLTPERQRALYHAHVRAYANTATEDDLLAYAAQIAHAVAEGGRFTVAPKTFAYELTVGGGGSGKHARIEACEHTDLVGELVIATFAYCSPRAEEAPYGVARCIEDGLLRRLRHVDNVERHLANAGIGGGLGYIESLCAWLRIESEVATYGSDLEHATPADRFLLTQRWHRLYTNVQQRIIAAATQVDVRDPIGVACERSADEMANKFAAAAVDVAMALARTDDDDHVRWRVAWERVYTVGCLVGRSARDMALTVYRQTDGAVNIDEAAVKVKRAEHVMEPSLWNRETRGADWVAYLDARAEHTRFDACLAASTTEPDINDARCAILARYEHAMSEGAHAATVVAVDAAAAAAVNNASLFGLLVLYGRLSAPDAAANDAAVLDRVRALLLEQGVPRDVLTAAPPAAPFVQSAPGSPFHVPGVATTDGQTTTTTTESPLRKKVVTFLDQVTTVLIPKSPPASSTSPQRQPQAPMTCAEWLQANLTAEQWRATGRVPQPLTAAWFTEVDTVRAIARYTAADWAKLGLSPADYNAVVKSTGIHPRLLLFARR